MATPKSKNRNPDLRDMLLAAGVGQYTAIMSVPYMMMLPTTTDPYAQGVIQLAQGLQRLLNRRGARLDVDGGMGRQTVRALTKYAGPRWYDKSWAQLYGDVMAGKVWGGWDREARVDLEPQEWGSYANPQAMSGWWDEESTSGPGVPYYCSPANPQGGCTAIPGVAKAMNPATLELFKSIQRSTNALLAKRGKSPISVDGRIGPGTIAAMKSVQQSLAAIDHEAVARQSPAVLDALQHQMVQESATPVADPPAPLASRASGNTVVHPPAARIAVSAAGFGMFHSPLGLAALAVGGMLIYTSFRSKKKGRRS